MDATADDWMFDGYDGEEEGSDYSEPQDDDSKWGNSLQEKVKQKRAENAKNLGKFAEDGAAKTGSAAGKNGSGNSSFTSAVQNSRNAEKSGGSFANNVQGKTLEEVAAKSMPGGKIIVNQAKKLGPFGTILMIIMVLVGVFAGSQSMAPFGLVSNGLDQFNNLRTSMNRRTSYFKRFKLDRTRNKPVTRRATIFWPEHFKVSNRMQKKLGKQNIYYFSEADGYGTRFLVYEDNDTGTRYAVSANGEDFDDIPDSVRITNADGEEIELTGLKKMKIDDALIESDNFSRSFDVGTRTLKGHIAGWFDDLSDKFHLRIGSSRNKQKNTKKNADEDEIEENARKADKGMSESIDADDTDAKEDKGHYKTNDDGTEGDWEPDYENVESDSGVDKDKTRGMKPADVEADVESSLTVKAKGIVAGIGSAANIACTVLKVYSALNIIMAGIQVANILNFVTGFLEAIQKTQTGDGGKTELAYYMNKLSVKGNTYGSTRGLDTHVDYDTPVRENTSSLESPAWNQFFSSGGLVVQASDPVAMKFNREYVAQQSIGNLLNVNGDGSIVGSIIGLVNNVGSAAAAYKTCLYVDSAAEAIEAAIDIFLAFFTVGIGNAIKSLFKGIFKSLALAAVVAVITSIFMSFLPQIAQWMTMDLIGNMAGEDAAYAINSGFNIYAGGQMQMSSGLPATEEKLMAHWREQQIVIAEEGALERSMKSPFDPTSKYTFVGSIVNSLIPIANTWSSPITTISKTVGTVGTAFMGLRPTASAEGEAVFETSLNYDCPNLSDIGVVGDAYCNPYFVTDFSTMADDPSYVFDQVAQPQEKTENPTNGNFIWDEQKMAEAEAKGEGYNPEINPKGELAKWVVACAVRDSGFGVVDSNVMNAVTLLHAEDATLDTIVNTGVSAIPVIGNLSDIAQNFEQIYQFGWATGEHCVSEDYKYYSRYSEDQRMMESSGIIEESAVAKFLDDYYEKNPIDNSWEGKIARYSGMTKDDVEETLATIEALEWYANYNPKDAGPEDPLPEPEQYQYESNEIVASAEKAIVGDYVVYDDLRTKTKIA